jgi:hypothetical protein
LIQTPRLVRIRNLDETRPSIPLLRGSNRFLRFHTASVISWVSGLPLGADILPIQANVSLGPILLQKLVEAYDER